MVAPPSVWRKSRPLHPLLLLHAGSDRSPLLTSNTRVPLHVLVTFVLVWRWTLAKPASRRLRSSLQSLYSTLISLGLGTIVLKFADSRKLSPKMEGNARNFYYKRSLPGDRSIDFIQKFSIFLFTRVKKYPKHRHKSFLELLFLCQPVSKFW